MLSKKQIQQQIAYWHQSAQEKLKTVRGLYQIRRYADCLFFGHLILEQTLKALVAEATREHPPRSHNLTHLANLADISLSAAEINLLDKVSEFNMDARYPDEKLEFYKICTKSYTDQYYLPIIALHNKLCQLAKSKN